MYSKQSIVSALVVLALLLGASIAAALPGRGAAGPLGASFMYQGLLKDEAGNPISDTCDFRFRLWDDPSAGVQVGADSTAANVIVADGCFIAQVNAAGEFGGAAFDGQARWLEVGVRCGGEAGYTALTPRQPLTAAPYASYASSAGSVSWGGLADVPAGFADGVDDTGGGWSLSGNAGTNPSSDFIGTTDNATLTLRVNNAAALRLAPNATSPNLTGGHSSNVVSDTVVGATIGGGGNNSGPNRVMADYAVVGGGVSNSASGWSSTVGGGYLNTASGSNSTVGGGGGNTASGQHATVPGGYGALADHYGQMAYANGGFGTAGSAQASLYVMRNLSTGSAWTNLYLDGYTTLLTIAPTQTLAFEIMVVGHTQSGTAAGYRFEGVIKNFGVTALVGSPTGTILGEDESAWEAQVAADDAHDALLVQVHGSGEDISWVATVRTAEVACLFLTPTLAPPLKTGEDRVKVTWSPTPTSIPSP